jgi:hypothetical protein
LLDLRAVPLLPVLFLAISLTLRWV